MIAPRRRLARPPAPPGPDPRQAERLGRLRQRLAGERAALARWMTRPRRAFHLVEQLQRSIARLERAIAKKEDP